MEVCEETSSSKVYFCLVFAGGSGFLQDESTHLTSAAVVAFGNELNEPVSVRVRVMRRLGLPRDLIEETGSEQKLLEVFKVGRT